MADIISGSSRFNGDKNAPARKVIQMNNVSEAATHETEDDEIVKHRIKKHRRHMVIIAAIGVIVIAIAVVLVMRLIDGYVFTSYSVTGSLNREDIESSGYIAYGDGYIRYSNDGAAYYTAKGKALWNQTYSMQKPQVKICEDCVAIGDINGNTIYIFNKNGIFTFPTRLKFLLPEIFPLQLQYPFLPAFPPRHILPLALSPAALAYILFPNFSTEMLLSHSIVSCRGTVCSLLPPELPQTLLLPLSI